MRCRSIFAWGMLGLLLMSASSASTAATANAAGERAPVKYWMESVNSPRTLAYMAALAGASREATKLVYNDFSKRVAGQAAPKIRVVNNEVELNGKKSGLKIVAYQPLKLAYQGKVWSATPGQSADKVYFELIKLFSNPRKTVHRRTLLFDEARASGSTVAGAGAGMLVGGVAGTMTGWLAGLGLGGWAGWIIAGKLAAHFALGGPAGLGAGLAVGALFAYLGSEGGAAVGGLAGMAIGGAIGGASGGPAIDSMMAAGAAKAEDLMTQFPAKDCDNIVATCTDNTTIVKGNGAVMTAKKVAGKNELELIVDGKPVDLAKGDPQQVQELSGLLLQCGKDEATTLTDRARAACRLASDVAKADTPAAPAAPGGAAGQVK